MKNEDKERLNLLNLLEDFHKRLLRLEQITMEKQGQPIYTNIQFPTHDLPSNTKIMANSGLTNEVGIPICSTCHRKIDKRFYVCHHCHEVLCDKPSCSLIYLNKAHCEECLRRFHFDLSKSDYQVLACLINGFKNTRTIKELTRISQEEIESSISRLLNSNFVVKEPIFFGLINELKLSDDGMAALTVFRQVYGSGMDIVMFGKELRKKLSNERGIEVVISP